MAKKKIDDEALVAALMTHSTISAAAEACGISPRTVFSRMAADSHFRAAYMMARSEVLREAVFHINNELEKAVETVTEIMSDREINPAIRLRAAEVILANAAKFTDRLRSEETASMTETCPPDPWGIM